MLETFRLLLLRCAYLPQHPVPSPHHPGTALRGAFGASLFQRACFEQDACQQQQGANKEIHCSFPPSCLYHTLFASDDPQYIFSPLSPSTASFSASLPLSFYMVLLGRATEHLPLLLRVLSQARPFKQEADLVVESLESYDDTQPELIVCKGQVQLEGVKLIRAGSLLGQNHPTGQVQLEFLTPTYITKKDVGQHTRVVKHPDFLLVMQALNRRLKRWAETEGVSYHLPGEMLELAKSIETVQSRLYTVMDSRFSKRQEQEVWLGGLLGHMTFENVPHTLLAYLKLAEYLHLGKKTVYGNGKVRLACY